MILSVNILRDNGETLSLAVDCQVSGGHRAAVTQADPDSCSEAEYPEIEPVSATLEEGDGGDFDLAHLSQKESRLLDEALARKFDDAYYSRRYDESY